METIIPWEAPISATWARATELTGLTISAGKLTVDLVEENTRFHWRLTFEAVQAVRLVTEECAAPILVRLPPGGFFEAVNSQLLKDLRQSDAQFLENARHFIICCYDEVLEVVGSLPTFERTAVAEP